MYCNSRAPQQVGRKSEAETSYTAGFPVGSSESRSWTRPCSCASFLDWIIQLLYKRCPFCVALP